MHYMHYKDYIHHGLAAEKTPPPCHRGGEPSGWVGGGVGVPAHIYIYVCIYAYVYMYPKSKSKSKSVFANSPHFARSDALDFLESEDALPSNVIVRTFVP